MFGSVVANFSHQDKNLNRKYFVHKAALIAKRKQQSSENVFPVAFFQKNLQRKHIAECNVISQYIAMSYLCAAANKYEAKFPLKKVRT